MGQTMLFLYLVTKIVIWNGSGGCFVLVGDNPV